MMMMLLIRHRLLDIRRRGAFALVGVGFRASGCPSKPLFSDAGHALHRHRCLSLGTHDHKRCREVHLGVQIRSDPVNPDLEPETLKALNPIPCP